MKYEEIMKLIEAVSESSLTEFNIEEEGTKLQLKKEEISSVSQITSQTVTPVVTGNVPVVDKTTLAPDQEPSGNVVTSPLVGTFYAAPTEDADAFVSLGDEVKKGQTLAIVEAMKLMNDIESDFSGKVVEIYVKNGAPVEFGQPLFRIA